MSYVPFWEIVVLLMMASGIALGVRMGFVPSFTLLVNAFAAGLLAFNFFEPLARVIGYLSPPLDAYADGLSLVALLGGAFGVLQMATLWLCPGRLSLPPLVQRLSGGATGALAAYLLAGIVLCTLQTFPTSRTFLGYDPDQPLGLGAPDRAWLALAHRASGVVFDYHGSGTRWFDADGSFVERYARYRRRDPHLGAPLTNRGEFPAALPTQPRLED